MDTFEALRHNQSKVVSLSLNLKRWQFQKENRWELSKEHLDWIAADVWPGNDDTAVKITVAKGKEPKGWALTWEAKRAQSEIELKLFDIDRQIEKLSEPALKGLAFAARERATEECRNASIWEGIAAEVDRHREIAARYRTGKGVWFAIVDVTRWDRKTSIGQGVKTGEEKCSKRKAVLRRLVGSWPKMLNCFDDDVTVEAMVKCDLEWLPDQKVTG